MKILVTGGTGKLATELKKYIKADFLSKEQLNLSSKERISQLPNYDILIHTATGSIDISLNLNLLMNTIQPKKIFAFTSRQGTYLNWKENNNIEINSLRSKIAKKMINGKMKSVIKKVLLKEIHSRIIEFLQDYINTHRLELSRKMIESLKHYKLKNPEYIEKVILEEMNLLGYVFYKNHVDIDLSS